MPKVASAIITANTITLISLPEAAEAAICLLQLHVLPEGASEPAALLGCIRLVHWLAQSHVLGPQPLTLVVDCGTGTTATGAWPCTCLLEHAEPV